MESKIIGLSFETYLKKYLVESGMFEDNANEVVERVKNAPENDVMEGRWTDGMIE